MMRYISKLLSVTILVLSVCMLCSCSVNRDEDIAGIREIPKEFIDALYHIDEDAADECCPGFDLRDWEEYSDAHKDMIRHVVSFAEITEMGEPVFYDEQGFATMDVTVSYLPLDGYYRSLDTYYMTIEEIRESLDDYDDRKEKTIDLEFEYDEGDGCWYLERNSARKIYRLFNSNSVVRLMIVDYSNKDAKALFEEYLRSITEARDVSSLPGDIDVSEYRYYDDSLYLGQTDRTDDAVARFIAAYMDYVLSHDYELWDDHAYSYELHGSAPSYDDLVEALTSDEYYIQYHANLIRYAELGMSIDEMADVQNALIYDTLAEAVPQCSPEEYYLYGSVSPYAGGDDECHLYGELINFPYGINNSYEINEDDYYRYIYSAIDLLYDNGEIDEEQYESLTESVVPMEEAFYTDVTVSSSGHTNQAVNTYEYVPSWDDPDDPVIIYAQSDVDENGIWMFYSKGPGWLHTAGYCFDEDGIWIDNYFDRLFYPGNEVIVDWWLDDDLIVDTQIITVPGLTNEIEVFLPVDELPEHFYYEMRLWEADHSHVISYVTLTR